MEKASGTVNSVTDQTTLSNLTMFGFKFVSIRVISGQPSGRFCFLIRCAVLFVGLLGGLIFAATEPSAPPFPFAEAAIVQLQARMQAGELTAHTLTSAYLARIAEIDRVGPALRAVIEINPDALAIADRLDAERKAGHVRGPMHGIPVLIKDNIGTADRMETTAGSLALVGSRPPHDAVLVTRLRDAGAVILGKTNLSEWANFRSERSSSGWSGRGGQTRNPYVLDRNPSGSSSGSAVAVSANLCVVAVGTETDGSIVSPASANGIVGVKPTVGLVSRTGIIPISATQDTAGAMARRVGDAAILLRVLAGADPADAATQVRPVNDQDGLAAKLPADALRGARLGVMRQAMKTSSRVEALWIGIIAALRKAGAEIVDPVAPPDFARIWPAEEIILNYEFKAGINAWLASLGPDASVKSLAELIAFNEAHRAQEMAFFGQEALVNAQALGGLDAPGYLEARALARRLSRDEGIDAIMTKDRLDAIVTITAGPAWPTDHVNGDHFTGGSSSMAAVAGYPSVTVPAGDDFGLPIGVSFTGRAWSEAALLALAADFEAVTHVRRAPQFLPTLVP
jgi:amidase